MAIVGTARRLPMEAAEDLAGGQKRVTRLWLVETDSPLDHSMTALTAPGLPQLYDPLEENNALKVVGRFPRRHPQSRKAWHVECEYSTNYRERDDNPFTQKPEIEWDAEPFDEPLPGAAANDYTIDTPTPEGDGKRVVQENQFAWGTGILNSAGDPFDPPPTIPNYLPVVHFTRNEETFDARLALLYGNTTNKTPWNGLANRQALLRPIKATHQVHVSDKFDQPDIAFWRVRYTFVLKADTWDLALLNIGKRYLSASPNNNQGTVPLRKYFRDLDGKPEMGLLKEDGTRYKRQGEDGGPEEPKPTFVIYQVRRAVDFAGLNININLGLNELLRR